MDPNQPSASDQRLNQQLVFLAELDKLKDILRQSLIAATRRHENSAEHSWHLAMMAVVLMEHATLPETNQLRVLKMVLIHDIVEIDAGDTFCYDVSGHVTKAEREQAAALRIFSLLPPDQTKELRQLWDEFEAGDTPESKLAQALDRVQAILQNLRTDGAGWRRHRVTKAQVLEYNKKIGETLPALWASLGHQLDLAEAQGFFRPPDQK